MKKRVLSLVLTLSMLLSMAPAAAFADIIKKDDVPDVNATSYAIIDGDTNQVLFGKKYDEAMDPGTLVQMMTAVIIIESGNLNDSVTVPEIPDAANKGNRLYLRKGEKINLSSLLEGIIIYNANDAAIAAAKHIAGSEEAFIDEMNARAKELGMSDTTFASVYGKADGQTTTARDMAILAAHASTLPKYVELAIQPTLDWESEMNQDTVTNVNGMQDVEDNAVGIKLNDSEPINLTASLTKSNRTIVGAMLDCKSEDGAYTQMQECLNVGIENTSVVNLVTKGTTVTTMNFSKNKSVRAAASKDYAITTIEGDSSNYSSVVVLDKVELPISKGDKIGEIKIYEDDKVIDEVPLKAQDSVKGSINWWLVLCVLLIIVYIGSVFYLFKNMHHVAKHVHKKAPQPRALQGKAPQSRVTRAPQKRPAPKNGQHPQTKKGAHPPQKPQASRKPTNRGLNATNMKNPSVGSNAGRQGLEQRLKEKNNGGRR